MSLSGTAPVLANSPAMWDGVRRAGERIVRAGHRGAAAARGDDAGGLPQRGHGAAGHQRVGQLDQAPAGGRARGGMPRRRAGTVRRARRPGAAALRRPPQRAGASSRTSRRAGRRPGGDGAAARPARPRRPARWTAARWARSSRGATVADEEVIRPRRRTRSAPGPTIVIVRGSLAPGGAVIKRPVGDRGAPPVRRDGAVLLHPATRRSRRPGAGARSSPARCSSSAGSGVVGGPGMALGSAVVFALEGAGLGDSVAVVTDGQMSGLVNVGTVVGEVSPGGGRRRARWPWSRTATGSSSTSTKRTVDLDVPDDVLAERRARLGSPDLGPDHGWLSAYRRLVSPVPEGAVLTAPSPGRAAPRRALTQNWLDEPGRRTPVLGEYDVVVVGGGPAGVMAAAAAGPRRALARSWSSATATPAGRAAPAGCPPSAGCTPTCTASTGRWCTGWPTSCWSGSTPWTG